MSSIAKVTVTFAPVTGRPFFVIWSANLFGAAALFGCTSTFSVYGPWCTTDATGPGPTFASALPSSPRNFDGRREAREERRGEHGAGDDHRLGRDRGAQLGHRARAAPRRPSRGFVRRRLIAPNTIASSEQPRLDQDHLPVVRRPERREDRQVEHGGPDPGAEQHEDGDERHGREARHGEGEHGRPERGVGAPPEDEQPDQAAEPERAGADVEPVERHGEAARRGLRGVPRDARDEADGRRGRGDADPGEQLGDRPLLALGPVDPERDPAGDDEEREAEQQVDVAAAEGGRPPERHERWRRRRTIAASRRPSTPRGTRRSRPARVSRRPRRRP